MIITDRLAQKLPKGKPERATLESFIPGNHSVKPTLRRTAWKAQTQIDLPFVHFHLISVPQSGFYFSVSFDFSISVSINANCRNSLERTSQNTRFNANRLPLPLHWDAESDLTYRMSHLKPGKHSWARSLQVALRAALAPVPQSFRLFLQRR